MADPQAERVLPRVDLVVATSTAVILVAAVTVVVHGGHDVPLSVTGAIVTAAWMLAGLALRGAPGRRPLRHLLLTGALCGAVGLLGRVLWASQVGGDGATALQRLGQLSDALGSAVLFHIGVSFPDGRLGSRPRRVIVALGYALGLAVGLATARHGYPTPRWVRIEPAATVAVGVGVSAVFFWSRYLQADERQRRRMQWMGGGAALVSLLALSALTANLLLGRPRPIAVVLTAITVLFPVALATDRSRVAARRAERAASLALIGLAWVALACGVLLLAILGIAHRPAGDERTLLVVTLAAVGVVALAAPILRRHVHGGVYRLVFGDRPPHDQANQVLAAHASRGETLEELLHDVVGALAVSQGPLATELWVRRGGGLVRTVSVPECGAERVTLAGHACATLLGVTVAAPEVLRDWVPGLPLGEPDDRCLGVVLAHRDELVGLLVVQRTAQSERFSERDLEDLTDLARQLGLVLHNAQLDSTLTATQEELRVQAVELQASRARIVASADAERRRIERDIHDGAQQQLVALAMGLEVVRELLHTDPDEAATIVGELRDELQTAIDDLRTLAHGIYPPLLAERGLGDALCAVTLRRRPAVSVRVTDVERHPAVVEAAVYFCCLEALQNVSKHAPDATVLIEVVQRSDRLSFTVTDTGPGFEPATVTWGHGHQNMVDRIGAIGGTVGWHSAPGLGTVVEGHLALRSAARPSAGVASHTPQLTG